MKILVFLKHKTFLMRMDLCKQMKIKFHGLTILAEPLIDLFGGVRQQKSTVH